MKDIRSKRVASTKKACITFRLQGYDMADCAALVGLTPKTIKEWEDADDTFREDLDAAWRKYKGRLIKKVEDKDPKYLLQNDFSDRFKKDKEIEPPQQTAVFIGYDKLAEQLAGFLSGSYPTTDSSTPPREVERIEARGTSGTS